MRRRLTWWRVVVALVVLGSVQVLTSSGAAGAEPRSAGPFTEPAAPGRPARDWLLFEPSSAAPPAPSGGRPLLVMLHGCTQTVAELEVGSRMSKAAEARGWVVVYPQQAAFTNDGAAYDGNGGACWNWFLPDHMHRGSGEPATIAAITERVVARGGIDPARVFVAGISAGADMATTMAVAYPDLFAAVGHLAGCAYSGCSDVTGALTVAEMGVRARIVPAMLVQGTADVLNNVAMGETSLAQWLGAADHIDDGQPNGSVPRRPASTQRHVPEVDPSQQGDPCVEPRRFPCAGGPAGFQGSYPIDLDRFETAGGGTVVERWLVHGMGHAYPGGDPAGTFVDPLGPDLTTAFLDFFDAHPMAAVAPPVVPEGRPLLLVVALALVAAVAWTCRARRYVSGGVGAPG